MILRELPLKPLSAVTWSDKSPDDDGAAPVRGGVAPSSFRDPFPTRRDYASRGWSPSFPTR